MIVIVDDVGYIPMFAVVLALLYDRRAFCTPVDAPHTAAHPLQFNTTRGNSSSQYFLSANQI